MAMKYATEEERLEARRARKRKYYQQHKKEILERNTKYRESHMEAVRASKRNYYQEHRTERAEHKAIYLNTKEGRACYLITNYKRKDKEYNRGDCDLTVPWFIRNIFDTKCIYCGETDWKKLGADRIDNSKAHTIENVVPCCLDCNNKRHTKSFEEFYLEMKHKTLGD